MELPKPVAGTIANWLDSDVDLINPEIMERMKSLMV